MSKNTAYRTINVHLPAGGVAGPLTINARFMRVLSATEPNYWVQVEDGQNSEMPPGVGFHSIQNVENIFFISNSAVDISIVLAVANGPIDDQRFVTTTALIIKPAANTFTFDGAKSVTPVASKILNANSDRVLARAWAGTGNLWLGPDNTVMATGIPTVASGGEFEIKHKGEVWAIRLAVTLDAAVYEEIE